MVKTEATTKYISFLSKLMIHQKDTFINGPPGTGKSLIIAYINKNLDD